MGLVQQPPSIDMLFQKKNQESLISMSNKNLFYEKSSGPSDFRVRGRKLKEPG